MTMVLSKKQEARLTTCTQQLSDLLKVDYDAEDVQAHKEFIAHIADGVSTQIAKLYPVYETYPKLPNGSFFQRTKIEEPNEFDFLNPFVFSEHRGIRTKLAKGSLVWPGSKDVYISEELQEILNTPRKKQHLGPCDYTTINTKLDSYDDLLVPVHKAVSEALEELDKEKRIVYKGICELKRINKEPVKVGETDPRTLKLNEVMLDSNNFGPCITIVVGGPLCVTHFDMTFCIEDHREFAEAGKADDGRYFVLPSLNRNWIPTLYAPGTTELNEHHRKILMILKFCLGECRKYKHDSTYNSHVLKNLVFYHCEKCNDETTLGICFHDVIQHVFRMKIDGNKTNDQYICLYTTKWLEDLKNVRYPKGVDNLKPTRDVPRFANVLFTLVLYILVEFIWSSPEAESMLTTREFLSLSLKLICKYSVNVLDFKSKTQSISKDGITEFIKGTLDDLKNKGDSINHLLSSPALPSRPYWPDPNSPIHITKAGTIVKIDPKDESQRWKKWSEVIRENLSKEEARLHEQAELKRQKEDEKKAERRREDKPKGGWTVPSVYKLVSLHDKDSSLESLTTKTSEINWEDKSSEEGGEIYVRESEFALEEMEYFKPVPPSWFS